MAENTIITDCTYPEKFSKRNNWYGEVTVGYIMAMHGKPKTTAYRLLKRIKLRLQKEHIFIPDMALHFGYATVKDYVEEVTRNLK
jgi:hypothetical protein